MNKTNKQLLLGAAIAGMVGASLSLPHVSFAAADKADEGKCMSANDCKGHGGCATAKNDCAGKNGCKGEGFVKTTAANCKKLSKTHKGAHFEKMEEKKDDASKT